MPRASTNDFLHNFRFHAVARLAENENIDPFQNKLLGGDDVVDPRGGFAGFNNISMPDLSIESTEYRDGLTLYTLKQPGYPTVGDCTLSRGVTFEDTTFYEWALNTIAGRRYRCDVDLYHFKGEDFLGRELNSALPFDPSTARTIRLINCFPSMCKPDADFDGTGSDISLMEMTLSVERVEIILAGANPIDYAPAP
jgi:phage tail-like protein